MFKALMVSLLSGVCLVGYLITCYLVREADEDD